MEMLKQAEGGQVVKMTADDDDDDDDEGGKKEMSADGMFAIHVIFGRQFTAILTPWKVG